MALMRFDAAKRAARISAELIRYRPSTAPSIVAKALIARSVWGIEMSRFLMLGMHDQRMNRWADSMAYGFDLEPGLRTINWQGDGKRLTVDKLMTTERFAQAGIPSAPLVAVIGRDSSAHPHEKRFPALSTADEIVATLASCPDQLFAKPATGWRGEGILGPERYAGGWTVHGTTLSDRGLAERLLRSAPPAGLLLQHRLRSHQALTAIGGNLGLACVRINTALTTDGPEVLFAFAKIMGAKGLVDNFAGGRFGNMLASVDNDSGRLTQVFGRNQDQRYLMERVTTHPLTGASLLAFQLPLWREAVALAKRTASSFPEAPLIGADVAITDDGPRIIEIQSDWDANAAQLMTGMGLRPVLRDLVPRLALSKELKERAFQEMGLAGGAQKRKFVKPQPRA